MSAFGRGRRRTLAPGLSAAAIAFAASLACADAQLASGSPILSPEAPVSFGDLAGASPLLAVLRPPAAEVRSRTRTTLAEPKLDLSPAIAPESSVRSLYGYRHREEPGRGPAETRSTPERRLRTFTLDRIACRLDSSAIRRRSQFVRILRSAPSQPPPDNPPVVYDPTVGPSLSPMQSALQAALERLVARDDRATPWAQATGAPPAARSRPSTPGAPTRRCGSAKTA